MKIETRLGTPAFFALAFGVSWAWVVPMAAAGLVVRRGEAWPTLYPALLGPATAAVAVTAWTAGRPGVRDLLGRLVRWPVPSRWWLVAVSPLAFLGLGLLAMLLVGKPLPAPADFGKFSGTPAIGLLGVALLITFVGALGEEVGWRGYALPGLQRRLSPLAATLVLAPLWFACTCRSSSSSAPTGTSAQASTSACCSACPAALSS